MLVVVVADAASTATADATAVDGDANGNGDIFVEFQYVSFSCFLLGSALLCSFFVIACDYSSKNAIFTYGLLVCCVVCVCVCY